MSVLGKVLLLSLVLASGPLLAQAPTPRETNKSSAKISAELKPFIKDYDASTNLLRAGFIPYKSELVWGEPLKVAFVVENLGPQDFEFMFGGDYRGSGRHNRFKIAVLDADGKLLPDPRAQVFDFGGFVQREHLKPGQTFSNIIDLDQFRSITTNGVYTVNCSFALDDRWIPQNQQSNPVIKSSFTLTILGRAPERVARVLDELVAKAQASVGNDIAEILNQTALFGQVDAVPRLGRLARDGAVELRVAALNALSLIPTDPSMDVVLVSLKDSDPRIRVAAAGSLGAMQQPRAVEALLKVLPEEKSPVTEAIVLALGTSKSDLAFPVITNTLDVGAIDLQRAAVNALVSFGGSNASAALTQRINTNFLSLRYEIVLALAEKMRQPMQAAWLSPVLIGREQNHEWLDSLRLLRMYGGDQAISSLLSYLDFDSAWSGRNWWILHHVTACPKAPAIEYDYDPNSDGTPEQWEKNVRTLQALRPLAGAIPISSVHPEVSCVPYLKTDPPIDFAPTFKEIGAGGIEIKSGLLTLSMWRGGANFPYSVPDSYRATYEIARQLRSLPNRSERLAVLTITSEQLKQLNELLHNFAVKLCGSRISDQKLGNLYNLLVFQSDSCPTSDDWHFLLKDYKETPTGPLKERAKADLIDSVRVFSQNYHAGTLEFVEAAKKILTPAQLEQLLR